MKINGLDHPKTLDLADRLRCSLPQAIGHLELLFAFCARQSPAGDIGKWPNGAIARASYWEGDSAAFITALVGAGYLDEDPKHRLLVHDWHEHAPRWVRAQIARKGVSLIKAEITVATTVPPVVANTDSTDDASSKPSQAKPSQAKEERPQEPAAPDGAGRSTPHLIPDDWQPDPGNLAWLVNAGMAKAEQADAIDEFKRWAKLSGLRRANWDLAFARNPAVKSAVGRAKAKLGKPTAEPAWRLSDAQLTDAAAKLGISTRGLSRDELVRRIDAKRPRA